MMNDDLEIQDKVSLSIGNQYVLTFKLGNRSPVF